MPPQSLLRHDDFYAWSLQQAALLRAGRLEEADLAGIAEEIERLGRTDKRELTSRLAMLLLRLLKWRCLPRSRSEAWRLSIANSRDEIRELLSASPSLTSAVADAMIAAYRYARRRAIATELPKELIPPQCPWGFAEAMDEDYWPE
jgi:hypothetical protein